jgi:hypothetical protein
MFLSNSRLKYHEVLSVNSYMISEFMNNNNC